jgi:flagellin
VGSEAGDTIDLKVKGFSAAELGGAEGSGDVIGAAATNGTLLAALQDIDLNDVNSTLTINSQSVGDLSGAATLGAALDTINAAVSGVKASAFVEGTLGTTTLTGNGIITGSNRVSFAILGQDGSTTTFEIGNTGSLQEIADKLNVQGGDLVQASVNDSGRLELNSDSATSITLGEQGVVGTASAAVGTAIGAGTALQARLSLELTSLEPGLVASSTTGGTPTINAVDIAFGTAISAAEIADIGVQARVDGDVTGSTTQTGALAAGALIINGVEIGAAAGGAIGDAGAGTMIDAINLQTASTGVVAVLSGAGGAAAIRLDSVDGSEISIEFAEASAPATATTTGLVETNASNSQGSSVDDINISTQAGATAAIKVVDLALEQINTQRADLGAINNRLDFTVSNLSNVAENTSAARSRIMDADFASETAELSRAQVLQQASQAILAQANARPQQVLSLLN